MDGLRVHDPGALGVLQGEHALTSILSGPRSIVRDDRGHAHGRPQVRTPATCRSSWRGPRLLRASRKSPSFRSWQRGVPDRPVTHESTTIPVASAEMNEHAFAFFSGAASAAGAWQTAGKRCEGD
jgi:hypothetical protein